MQEELSMRFTGPQANEAAAVCVQAIRDAGLDVQVGLWSSFELTLPSFVEELVEGLKATLAR